MCHRCILTVLISFAFILTSEGQLSLERQADSLSILKDYEQANTIYKQLLQTYEQMENIPSFLSVSTKVAINHQKNRNHKASIAPLEKAIEKSKGKIEPDSLMALAYHKLAVGYYMADNDDEKAIAFWQESLSIRKKIFSENHQDIIKGYRNIGTSFINLDNFENAEFYLKKSLDLHLSHNQKDSVLLGRTYNDLAVICTALEDFEKAEKYLGVAEIFYEKFFAKKPWILARVYELFFDLHKRQNHLDDMFYYANRILKIYEEWEDLHASDEYKIANSYHNLALTYGKKGDFNSARILYLKSIAINKRFEKKRGKQLGKSFGNLALIYRSLGQFEKAMETIEKSIVIYKKHNYIIETAEALDNKAEILLNMDKPRQALLFIDQSITIIAPSDSSVITEKPLLVDLLNDKIRILKALSAFENKEENLFYAIQISERIVVLLDQIRLDFQSDKSKQFLAQKANSIIAQAIGIHLELYELNQDKIYVKRAFELAERSRALILLDALKEAQAKQTTGLPFDLSNRELKLKKKIADLEKQLFDQQNNVSTIQNELVILNRDLEKLIDTLEQNYPSYFEAKYASTAFDLAEFQETIEGHVIEYFISDSIIYAFILSKMNLDVVEIPNNFQLKKRIQELRNAIYTPFLYPSGSNIDESQAAEKFVNESFLLYQKLIYPIQKKIPLSKQLIIIPDGVLGYIPFDVLVMKKPKQSTQFRNHAYMIKNHQISYCYSAALLQEMREKKIAKSQKTFIGFAPAFEPNDQNPSNNRIANVYEKLSPLNYNIPEVKALHEQIGGAIYLGEEASKQNFNQYASNFQIIHLATHGKANDQVGDYAYLAFSEIKDSLENEIIYNRDLYNLHLQADMVVLSACETGIGELQKGEGIISLARGFSYAGAKSIITTLWSINDAKTKDLMLDFYAKLGEGKTKDEALRQSKLELMDKYPQTAHPYYWAAFIPIGDMEAINIGNSRSWLKYVVFTFVSLLFCIGIWGRFIRSKV